jgi:hypothetical protein
MDFDKARAELETARTATSAHHDRKVAVIQAEATLALAEAVERLVAFSSAIPNPLATPEPDSAFDPIHSVGLLRSWEVGDVVAFDGESREFHVDSIGFTEGRQTLEVLEEKGQSLKVWAEDATFLRHDSTETPGLTSDLDGTEPADTLDDDFAEAENAGRKVDAFTAAKARAKKKGGK